MIVGRNMGLAMPFGLCAGIHRMDLLLHRQAGEQGPETRLCTDPAPFRRNLERPNFSFPFPLCFVSACASASEPSTAPYSGCDGARIDDVQCQCHASGRRWEGALLSRRSGDLAM